MEDDRHTRIFEASPVAQALSDENGLFVEVNAAYCTLVGMSVDQLIGRSATVHTHADDLELHSSVEDLMAAGISAGSSVDVEARFVRPTGELRWVVLTLVPFAGPEGAEWTLASVLDITDRKAVEDGILLAARTDQLTGALNRRGWSDYAVSVNSENTRDTVIALLDLDHFKQFNDRNGHAAGDEVLREFAAAARACIGVNALLARWGGEEFVVTFGKSSTGLAFDALTSLAAATPAELTFSAGYTAVRHGEGLRHALDRADRLMFQAKREGRNKIVTDAVR